MLDRAVPLLKAGGRVAYITCSVLDEENGAQVREFLARHPEFSVQPPAETSPRHLASADSCSPRRRGCRPKVC